MRRGLDPMGKCVETTNLMDKTPYLLAEIVLDFKKHL